MQDIKVAEKENKNRALMWHKSSNLKCSFNALIHQRGPPPSPASPLIKFPVHGREWWGVALFSPEGKLRSAQAEAAFPSSQVFLLQQMKRPFYFVFFFFSKTESLRAEPSNGTITLRDNPEQRRPKLRLACC